MSVPFPIDDKQDQRAGTIPPDEPWPNILSSPTASLIRFSRLCLGISAAIASGAKIGRDESGVNSGDRIIKPTGDALLGQINHLVGQRSTYAGLSDDR